MKKFLICFFIFVITGIGSAFLGVPGDATFIIGGICAVLYLVFSREKRNNNTSSSYSSSSSSSYSTKNSKEKERERERERDEGRRRERNRDGGIPSRSTSRNDDFYVSWREAEEERRQEKQWERHLEQKWEREQEQIKKERLESWYSDYVTIEVSLDYHIKDSEYNRDYWDHRSEDIRVTRREAMALIQAGEGALLGRLGYSNRGNIRNVSIKPPYGLYDRP